MRTTIDLPDSLLRQAKTRAIRQGTTLKNLLTMYIETGLRGQPTSDASVRTPRPPLPVAIPRAPGAPLTKSLTNRELNDLLEGEETDVVRNPQND